MKYPLMKSFIKIVLIEIIFLSSIFSPAIAQTSNVKYHSNPIIGLVDGNPVTFEDIRNKKINDLSLNLFQQLNIQFIEYSLKKIEKKYPNINLKPKKKVSLKEILSFFEQNNLKERGTIEQLEPQIRLFLEKQILQKHYFKQYSLAVKKGWIISHLETPSKYLIKGNIKTAFIRGNKKASVILIEFSDYHCPFCRQIQKTINNLIDSYSDRVAFGYRHFPLSFHREADEAAISVECAREQGKFEEMHVILYTTQNTKTKSDLKKLARQIKIKSPKKFNECLEKEKFRGLVNQDIEDGSKLGITGTPGFYLGYFDHNSGKIQGEILSGALPYDSFQKKIDEYLNNKL